MPNLPGPQLPVAEASMCVDCDNIFLTRDGACGKCGAEIGLVAVSSNRAASVIAEQRAEIRAQENLIDEAEGVLLTIAKRHLGPSSLLAWRMVDRIRTQKQKAPAATGAVEERRVAN